MNKYFRKVTAVMLAALLGTLCLAGAFPASAEQGIAIDEVNFPDEVWRNAVLDYIDTDETTGYLSSEEIAAAKKLFVSGWAEGEIKNLKGIEYFTACEELRITALGLETVDLSALSNLKILRAMGDNSFASLDLTANPVLYDVNVKGNKSLTELKLGSGVTKLQCDGCMLSSLNLSQVSGLTFLNCYDNELTELDLTSVPNLDFLDCSANHLKQLDLSSCPKLNAGAKSYIVGEQQVTAPAFADEDKSIIALISFDNANNILSSILGSEENPSGYSGVDEAFIFSDYDICISGIDYIHSVGFDGAEGMEVHINLEKNFFKVSYLTAENGEEYYYDLVQAGGTSAAPEFPQAPEGMVCVHFSGTAENVNEDTVIYAVWADKHSEAVTGFDNGIAEITCSVCGSARTAVFADHINAVQGNEAYEPLLDVNSDGVINSRDFAELSKQYK